MKRRPALTPAARARILAEKAAIDEDLAWIEANLPTFKAAIRTDPPDWWLKAPAQPK